MVKGDNPMTHFTVGWVRKDEEGRTWFREPAQDYDGNPLNNGFVQIRIPDPQRTVRCPVTFPMPNLLD